ncbi:recombinase family protein [Ruminococcus bovis]|uniref:Recombinase n=1 Tax=Ruminococcus bovis TaxID=2564099 RepID=A0A4P8XUG4_9FIRM|nr:recombinase family protein [Ruminococcus bovis]QCT06272.1 recombinase [Ruminococcus bovis]
MKVWLYYRLSRDEDEELNSLSNQRSILVEYAEKNGYDIVGESFDDNVSGMHFNREGINKIYEQVENDAIEAIIVKDMSRLGRHKTQTALFIDYLREHEVRVLSVTENLDTSNEDDDLIIGFKGLFNDMYARDISKKVRAGMVQKQKKGFVMIPPLGYFKDKNTGEIKVVEKHAEIVRRIFNMYLEGYGFSAIARILNEEGVKSPAYYQKKLLGKNLGYNKPKIGFKYLWDNTGVKRILVNDFYIGTLTCHKTYNNKITHVRKDLPKEEQFVHENFVTPIISKEKFNQVQKLIEQKREGKVRASSGKPCHRYSGLLKCGDCGSTFVAIRRRWRNKPERIEYSCNGYHRYGKENCTPHRINESELDELVYSEILRISEQAKDNYNKVDEEVSKWRKQKNSVTSKIKSLKGELAQRKTDQKEILLERIRDREHAEVYDEMLESCESDIKKIKTEIYEIENYDDTIKKRKAELKNTLEIMEEIVAEGAVSNSNLRQLIDKIVIHETADGLDIRIGIQADFTTHMKIYDGEGEQQADLEVIDQIIPAAMKRRMKPE